MTEDRVRVSRSLFTAALADTIGWEESFLATHDPVLGSVTSCCTPGNRCDSYRQAAELLARYKRAQATLRRARPNGTDAGQRKPDGENSAATTGRRR